MNEQQVRELARAVIQTEADGIMSLLPAIDDQFIKACETMLNCTGRIVVIGMGKSGHIGGKIAATLASTGTAAFFVHPAEAGHGDLGMILQEDVVLLLSTSGETDEVKIILPVLKRMGVVLIAMTGSPSSTLAQHADIHISSAVDKEACPMGLAPTTSSTAALVMGDALAISLLESRGFTQEDFARSHPAGRLGKRLLLHIDDIMHSGEDIPLVRESALVREAIVEMTRKTLGMCAVVSEKDDVLGIFTDGDLRRALDAEQDPHSTPVSAVMTRGAKSIHPRALAIEAVRMMEQHSIQALLVLDESGKLVGALNFQDALRAGVA